MAVAAASASAAAVVGQDVGAPGLGRPAVSALVTALVVATGARVYSATGSVDDGSAVARSALVAVLVVLVAARGTNAAYVRVAGALRAVPLHVGQTELLADSSAEA